MLEPFSVKALIDGGWRHCPFEHFREGIEIHHILKGEPAVALLRYRPGAIAPRHRHTGLESIVVLEGSQRDERGVYSQGDVVFNPAGSEHCVVSDDGCVVLIQWEKPIVFL